MRNPDRYAEIEWRRAALRNSSTTGRSPSRRNNAVGVIHRTKRGRAGRKNQLKEWGWRIVGTIVINTLLLVFLYALFSPQP